MDLPLSVSTHAANHHEVRLVQLCFDFYMVGEAQAKEELRLAIAPMTAIRLDEELRRDGIAMIAPHRANRTRAAHARSATTKPLYATLAHRTFLRLDTMAASPPSFAGEFPAQNFLGFVQLACLVVLFRRF